MAALPRRPVQMSLRLLSSRLMLQSPNRALRLRGPLPKVVGQTADAPLLSTPTEALCKPSGDRNTKSNGPLLAQMKKRQSKADIETVPRDWRWCARR